MTKSRIKHITHPHAWELKQARIDQARVTNQPLTEKPWWFEDIETGVLYHDIYGCIGWPVEVSDRGKAMPGYLGIYGVERPSDDMEHYNPADAKFHILDEFSSENVPSLLTKCLEMRDRWGFGVQPDLLATWYGDAERFQIELALRNEFLVKRDGPKAAILITPPDEFYTPRIFDNYVRAIKSCLWKGDGQKRRLFNGPGTDILSNQISEFLRDDPIVLAAGGLIYTLLCRTIWMDRVGGNAFVVKEGL